MPKTITSSELLPLLNKFQGDLLDFTTGFVRPHTVCTSPSATNPDHDYLDASLGGSGTLVTAAGVRAILTADHVLSEFPAGDPFGLIVLTRTGRSTRKIIADGIGRIPIARGNDESKGPDLGLLVLSPTDAADLEAAGKIFYNLSTRRNRMLNDPPPLHNGCAWVLCGMVGEWTREVPPERGFTMAKEFRGLYGPTVLSGHREEAEFDFLSVEVSYDEDYTGPNSFGGCSGGSLWQALLKDHDGAVVIDELLLAGVPFYQSATESNRRIIECHGRTSIYATVVEALERAASKHPSS